MSKIAENGEKVFNFYLHLPSETRMEIVDAMQADDRCRFTRCSKLSNKEAKFSKKFIYGLVIMACDEMVNIFVYYGDDKEYSLNYMRFEEMEEEENYTRVGEKEVECRTTDGKTVWREDLDSSTDIVLCAAEKFKELLVMYQSKIQSLSFIGESFKNKLKDFDFGIEKLTNLKSLCLHQEADLEQYFTKLRRPLKKLYVQQTRDRNLADFEQIYQVRDRLHIPHLKLNAEQFQALSASDVEIHIGHLTVDDIYRFISSWQNGTIGKKVEMYEWCRLEFSDFDVVKLFRRFGMEIDDTKSKIFEIEIKHNKEAGKSAKLSYNIERRTQTLTFVVRNDDGKWPNQ